MKLRVMIAVAIAVSFLSAGILYAGNGDLIVNGKLGVGTSTPAAKAEINGNATINGNLTLQGTLTAPNANIMTKYFDSGEVVISGSTTTVSHNIANPVLVQVMIVCKTAELGYAVGDVVIPNSKHDYGTIGAYQSTSSVWWNATQVGFLNDDGISITKKDASSGAVITNSKWSMIFRVWGF